MRRRITPGQGGNTALEFAMLAPVVVMLILMAMEVAYQGAVAAALDYGAGRAARLGVTGSTTANGAVASAASRQAAVRAAVLTYGGTLLQDPNLTVSESSYASLTAAAANLLPQAGPGVGGQVVRYDLTYVQPMLTGSLAATVFGRSSFSHSTSLVTINENFPIN